ncbi:MAG: CARDB domain-containing protein [Candidatus Thalassarchaeaceae archaeon]|nr:CARDB domain-containing protein [Candidatus Thalassarchaeaceae archaeon]
MASGAHAVLRAPIPIIGLILLLIGQSLSPLAFATDDVVELTQSRDGDVWIDGGIPWPQFGRTPGHESATPPHAPSEPESGELLSITNPVLNWRHYADEDVGVETLGVSVGNFSSNIDTGGVGLDSCARDSLSPVFIHQQNSHAFMRIVDGDTSQTMWEVDIGTIDLEVKSTPIILDVEDDGTLEIIVVYDANGQATVELWAPDIECDVTGWKPGGSHETERLWRWSHSTFEMAADRTCQTCHQPVAQPLLADLFLDNSPELVLAMVDDVNNEPNLVALPLPTSGTPSPIWEVTLGEGTHPSDPAWVQIDAVSSAILLTTIDENNGNMWVWKINAANGQVQYEETLNNLDGDTAAPHVRLPGPIITQLDSDPAPEMVVTIPTDVDGAGTGDGATFIGLDVTDAATIFSFSASNGYADAPPVLIDSDENGITDRICWNTWYRDGISWHGMVGCHDYNEQNQNTWLDWNQIVEGTSGNPNDEIAVSAPTPMDIDGTGFDEILVTFGRTIYAHDGETGSRSSINAEWVSGLELPHRTWAGHALADFDNDGALDLLVGDMLISQAGADIRPYEDGLAITFNPSTPDPGELVTVTAFFENAGTDSTDTDTFARMYVDGELKHTHREGALDPRPPTGNGNSASFSFDWSGGLGEHTFELNLDEHGNVTQTRTDNDVTTTVLTIIAPYNVSIGVPPDPVRVPPGGQTNVQPIITSTGRIASTWSMTIDDSGLPTNWTIVDLDPSTSSGVQIEVGASWSPTLQITAPVEALGTDSGFVEITMTLDSNQSISQTAILPIEAERTRGLSLRGADGTANSNGMGIPGEAAAAWILVENLGNAPETVSLQWQQTAWDPLITLHDSSGQEVNPLELDPNEIRELTARHDVPLSATLGENVSTQLSMCIGAGDDEECRTIDLTFTANQVQILPPHIRSVPADNRTWDIEVQLPSGVNEMEWDMATAGMIMPEWVWSTNGALSIDGTTLRVSGNTGARVTGSLILNMPYAAPPMLHTWTAEEANYSGCILSLSLQVLQIHRAILEVTSPVVQPHRMDVGVQETLMLRLSNPGNGPDAYDITWSVVSNANFTSDPGLQIQIPSSQYALGSGELRSVPVSLTLPQEMTAGVVLILRFEMQSIGDIGVNSTSEILIEARQDHRWEMELTYSGMQIDSGDTVNADPNTQLSFSLGVKNIGNLADQIDITPSITIQVSGGDEGVGWTAWGDSSGNVLVNGTQNLTIGVNTSASAWKDTVATITFNGLSDDTTIAPFIVHIHTNHVPGWWILAGGADLDIDRNGANISLVVEQRGNSPAEPFINGWVDAGGWNINVSENISSLSPGESTNFTCEITPPEGAISGHTVELTLRARNGDGTGMGQTTLPLRVAAWHDYSLEHEELWPISSVGGLPLAMLSNLGNAPTTINLEILGLPEGWALSGPNQVSLGVGESSGVPLSAIPPNSNQSGFGSSVTLRTTDESGTQREASLTLTQRDKSWATSPVLFGTSGDVLELDFNPGFDVNSVTQGSEALLQSEEGSWLWTVPVMDSDGQLDVDGITLDYWARVRDPPTRMGSCTVSSLGSVPQATCTIHNDTTEIDWTAILRDETGVVIDYASGHLLENTTLSKINLSAQTWNPAPGEHFLKATLLDGNGGLIAESTRVVLVRDTDWNLGITAVEMRESSGQQEIVISISRENQSKFSDAVCFIHLNADSWNARHRVNVGGELAPQITIERPGLPAGTTVDIELQCDEPWDIDSNDDDDTNLIVLPSGIAEPGDGLDYAMLLGSLVIVFGIMGLLGMIRPDSGPRKVEKRMRVRKRVATKTKSVRDTIEDDEDIHIEDEESVDSEPRVEVDTESEEIEIEPEQEAVLDEFEARLQRLREQRDRIGGR